jgi:hypothetical protein
MIFVKYVTILLLATSSATSYSQVNRVLFDARKNHEHTMNTRHKNLSIDVGNQVSTNNWQITNDGVMGGMSQGFITFNNDHGLFTGNISLDNNGGFSAIFTPIKSLHKNIDKVTVDIQGDGQTYQLRMVVNINGYRLSYNKAVKTRENIRESVTLQLSDFIATYRGRNLPNAPILTPEKIREVGFLMTKKQAGPFSLAIYNISFN